MSLPSLSLFPGHKYTDCLCQMLSPLALISKSIKELIPRRGDVPNGSPLSCLCPLREPLSLYQDKWIDNVISPKEAQNHTPDMSSRIDLSCRTWSRFRVGESTAFPTPFVRVCCEFDESEPWEFEAIAAIWALCFIKASFLETRSASMDFLAWIYAPPPAKKIEPLVYVIAIWKTNGILPRQRTPQPILFLSVQSFFSSVMPFSRLPCRSYRIHYCSRFEGYLKWKRRGSKGQVLAIQQT